MAIKRLTISQFMEQSRNLPVLDVRSPGEYNHAHIAGAYNLPLFSDEERKVVGIAYKRQGRQLAIKHGLDFFGVKMKEMIVQAEKIMKKHFASTYNEISSLPVIIHCWRGGMRSAGVAWLLDLYGFEVYTIIGGYKAYRNWVLQQFEKDYSVVLVGGYTGSGKTALIEQLREDKYAVVNLEKLANHKGSAFGDMGVQPTQEQFENFLAEELFLAATRSPIWMEDESQRIGQLNIPHRFWKTMRSKPLYFVDIPFNERLKYILETYGLKDKEKLINSISRIQKRLGPLETKTAINFLIEDNYKSCFEILLQYYDKSYTKSLHNREHLESVLNKISCSTTDIKSNTEKLRSCVTVNI